MEVVVKTEDDEDKNPSNFDVGDQEVFGTRELLPCDFCGKLFVKKASLKRHMLSHLNSRRWKCKQCDKSFAWKTNLNRHVNADHSSKEPKLHECQLPNCSHVYKTSEGLVNHMRRDHWMERDYPCDSCDKKFYKAEDLRNHYISHTGQKPYSCECCGSGFNSFRSKRAHEKKCRETKFRCPVAGCKMMFKLQTQEQYDRHMRAHDQTLTLGCNFCPKTFNTAGLRRSHERSVHTWKVNGRPYPCQHCDKTYTRSNHLSRHIAATHKHLNEITIKSEPLDDHDDQEGVTVSEERQSTKTSAERRNSDAQLTDSKLCFSFKLESNMTST